MPLNGCWLCYVNGSEGTLPVEMPQLCGFYFCIAHEHEAMEKGAHHWHRLYNALWPW